MEASQIFWELVRVAVPSALVILGWRIVSEGNDKRETRKEIRAFLDRTISSAEKIRDNSIKYFTEMGVDEGRKMEAVIDPDLKRLEDSLKRLCLRDQNNTVITAQHLRMAICSNSLYRSDQRTLIKADAPLIGDVNLRFAELIDELETAYNDTFHKDKKNN